MPHWYQQVIINSTWEHYYQSLSEKTKVSLHARSWNQCISITERNESPRDLCSWVMWNLSQVSPRGLDKIKDKTPEKLVLIRSCRDVSKERSCEQNLKRFKWRVKCHHLGGEKYNVWWCGRKQFQIDEKKLIYSYFNLNLQVFPFFINFLNIIFSEVYGRSSTHC